MGESKKDTRAYIAALLGDNADKIMPYVERFCNEQDSCLVCKYYNAKNCFMQRYIDERARVEAEQCATVK